MFVFLFFETQPPPPTPPTPKKKKKNERKKTKSGRLSDSTILSYHIQHSSCNKFEINDILGNNYNMC